MTNKEAIEFLKNMIDREAIGFVCPKGEGDVAIWQYHVEALQMAISALQAQDSPKPTAESVQNVQNDDSVSRKAAIDAVEHIASSMSICVNTDECHGMKRMQRQAVIELANLPSAQPEPQWIPVSERLPDDLGDYLVSIKRIGWNMEEYVENDIAYWDDLEGFHKADEVLAWMPLPEPYRAERRTNE